MDGFFLVRRLVSFWRRQLESPLGDGREQGQRLDIMALVLRLEPRQTRLPAASPLFDLITAPLTFPFYNCRIAPTSKNTCSEASKLNT